MFVWDFQDNSFNWTGQVEFFRTAALVQPRLDTAEMTLVIFDSPQSNSVELLEMLQTDENKLMINRFIRGMVEDDGVALRINDTITGTMFPFAAQSQFSQLLERNGFGSRWRMQWLREEDGLTDEDGHNWITIFVGYQTAHF